MSGFIVANFTNDQHLRILSEQVTRSGGEVQTTRLTDFRLHDARKNLFHWIFDGDDVTSTDFQEMTQTSVNCGRLSTSRRACQQKHSRGLPQKTFQLILHRSRQLELLNFL